jgi:hypothetical protein
LNANAKLFQLPLVFVDASKNLVMADDVATPSNLPFARIEEEKLEEASLDVNLFQWSSEEELSKKMVHIRINCLVWDRQMSFNPHALAIYL